MNNSGGGSGGGGSTTVVVQPSQPVVVGAGYGGGGYSGRSGYSGGEMALGLCFFDYLLMSCRVIKSIYTVV